MDPALSGKWIFRKAGSDSIAPFLKFMGAPWIAQKAADSSSPTWLIAVEAGGRAFSMDVAAALGPITMRSSNRFSLDEEVQFTAGDRKQYPATTRLGAGGVAGAPTTVARMSRDGREVHVESDYVLVDGGATLHAVIRIVDVTNAAAPVVQLTMNRIFTRA